MCEVRPLLSAEMLCSMMTFDNLNSHLVPQQLKGDLCPVSRICFSWFMFSEDGDFSDMVVLKI